LESEHQQRCNFNNCFFASAYLTRAIRASFSISSATAGAGAGSAAAPTDPRMAHAINLIAMIRRRYPTTHHFGRCASG
jgi:hypothetical protein